MHPDLSVDYCVFGGSADGFFGDTVLRANILYLCSVNDITVGVLAVEFADCAGGGVGTGALSAESFECGFGLNDGAEGEIYFAVGGANNCGGDNVGDSNVATNSV